MDEASQILELLSEPTFWEDDRCQSSSIHMAGGISVEIAGTEANWTWRMIRPDRSEAISPQAFPSVQEAKTHLRAMLNSRREALIYNCIRPANIS